MERQAVTIYKDSGNVNDANLWATETTGDGDEQTWHDDPKLLSPRCAKVRIIVTNAVEFLIRLKDLPYLWDGVLTVYN